MRKINWSKQIGEIEIECEVVIDSIVNDETYPRFQISYFKLNAINEILFVNHGFDHWHQVFVDEIADAIRSGEI